MSSMAEAGFETSAIGGKEFTGKRVPHVTDQHLSLCRIADDVEHGHPVMLGEGPGRDVGVVVTGRCDDVGIGSVKCFVVVPDLVIEWTFRERIEDYGEVQSVLGVVGVAIVPGENLECSQSGRGCNLHFGSPWHAHRDGGRARFLNPSDIEKVAICERHSTIGFVATEWNDVDLDSENVEFVRSFAPASKRSRELQKLFVGADRNSDIDIICGAYGLCLLLRVDDEIASGCADDEHFDVRLLAGNAKFGEDLFGHRDVVVSEEIDQRSSPKN